MKFLCDRCKTRYSIADERVRGKILKIRCKNCANVISVREGMTDDEALALAPSPSGSALQSAFANVMVGTRPGETQPPPPVLEEEWYVAIDGDQSGPFTLAEAQAWVSTKKVSEDLYCWCEGFDDWLPVEKVSHFRGLRRREESQVAKLRTPVPKAKDAPGKPARAASEPAPASRPAPASIEEEPKPLFAATLAKLEAETKKDGPPAAAKSTEKHDKPADRSGLKPASPTAAAKPPDKDKDKRGDSKDKAADKAPSSLTPLSPASPRAPLPMPTRAAAPLPSPMSSSSSPMGSSSPPMGPMGAGRGAQAAVASAVGAAAPALAREPAPEPAAAKPAVAKPAVAKPEPAKARSARPQFDTGEEAEPDDGHDGELLDDGALEPHDDGDESDGTDGLDLDIGEVSRVVRLPDLMAAGAARAAAKNAKNSTQAQRAIGRTSGAAKAIGRGSGSAPAIALAAGASSVGAAPMAANLDADGLPPLSDAVLADAQPQLVPSVAHRRNHHVMWMIAGAVLLIGTVVVVAVAASSGGGVGEQVSTGNTDFSNLGYQIDPLRPHGSGDTGGTGSSGNVAITGVHVIKRPNGNGGGNSGGSQQVQTSGGTGRQEIGPDGEPILPLTGDDIIQTSQKNSMGTGRCYDRALKKDPFLQVQKINVSLKVDASGLVTDVSLDGHAGDDLGQCLTAAIRRWGFRKSTEGINTVFPLVFQQGP